MPMNAPELMVVQAQVSAVARCLLEIDLVGYLDHLEHVDTVGPILDPTAYRAGMENVLDQRELAGACMKVQKVAERLWARADSATEVKP